MMDATVKLRIVAYGMAASLHFVVVPTPLKPALAFSQCVNGQIIILI